MSILDELRAGRIQKEALNDVQAAEARQLLIDEGDARIQAEQAASDKTHRSAVRQQGLNETVGPQQPRPVRSAETGAFSGAVDDAGDVAGAASQNRATDAADVRGLDRTATRQFQEPTPEAVNAAAAERGRGGPINQTLRTDVAPPIDSRTSKQALRINRNRRVTAGVAALGLGAAAVKGLSEYEISPAQVLAGAGVAATTAGVSYTMAQRKKIAATVKTMVAERKEDKASFKREAKLTRDGDETGAQRERTVREERMLARKNAKAGVIESGAVDSEFDGTTAKPTEYKPSAAQERKAGTYDRAAEAFQNQKARAQKTINTSRNPADVAAARAVLADVQGNIDSARAKAAGVRAEVQTPGDTPASDLADTVKAAAKDPIGTADDVANKTKQVFKDAGFMDDGAKGDKPEGRIKKMMKAAAGAPAAALKGAKTLGGKIAPSKKVEAEAKTNREKVNKGVTKVIKLGTAAELVNAMDDFGQEWSRVGFEQASDDMYEGAVQSMSDMMTRVSETPEGVERDGLSKAVEASYVYRETMMDMIKGFATTIGAEIPKKLFNLEADLADAMGMSITDLRFEQGKGFTLDSYVKPEGFSGFEGRTFRPGIDAQPFEKGGVNGATQGLREAAGPQPGAPGTDTFAGAPDPGALPGRPGERFDPLGTQALDSVETEPFLTPGAGEGQFNVGLRGNIDAGGAVGGASGFAQRVEESRRSGAYDPVSPERRDEATRDLDRVRRGTAAFRDLAATRLGVPTQYLDAVRSGAMTPREANLAQAKQAATGNLPTAPTAADQQDFAIKAQQANQSAQEFTAQMDDRTMERFATTGQEVADAFPNLSEEDKASLTSEYQFFAPNWLPADVDQNSLTSTDFQTVKGQFILAEELANKGEGWARTLMPWKSDITRNTLFRKGENILESMKRQGQWWDIGNDNLRFEGRDSAGESVTLTIETEKLNGIAQQAINQARGRMDIRRAEGLR